MSFAQDNGYTPQSFTEIMDFIRQGVNAQFGTAYTAESFVGTNWYKYFYTLAQKVSLNETKTAEIYHKLQQYIATTNEAIQRPSVSAPGLVESFAARGYLVSVKPPNNTDAGKIFIAVDVDGSADDYAATKVEIAGLIKDFVVGGIVSQGDQIENIVLSNGQSFPFKFYLPEEIPVELRLTAIASENTLLSIPDDETIRQKVFDNVNARYRLGLNFEPQRYFTLQDAPWAGSVLLEWSDDAGATWHEEIYDAAFNDKFTFGLDDIEVVIT